MKRDKNEASKKPAEKSKPISIPLPIVDNQEDELAREMSDAFNEDKVTHQHGGSEPEKD